VADKERDPWVEALKRLSDKIDEISMDWAGPAFRDDDSQELCAVAQGLDVGQLLAGITEAMGSIESWFAGEFRKAVGDIARRKGLKPDRWSSTPPRGWLVRATRTELSSLARAASTLRTALAQFYQTHAKYEGVEGFARGFVLGLANPFEAIAFLFGESTIDREIRAAEGGVEHGLSAFQDAASNLKQAILGAVVDRWNTDVERVSTQMDMSLRAPTTQTQWSSRVMWTLLILVLLAALVGGGWWLYTHR
jgi:hypothetical protein